MPRCWQNKMAQFCGTTSAAVTALGTSMYVPAPAWHNCTRPANTLRATHEAHRRQHCVHVRARRRQHTPGPRTMLDRGCCIQPFVGLALVNPACRRRPLELHRPPCCTSSVLAGVILLDPLATLHHQRPRETPWHGTQRRGCTQLVAMALDRLSLSQACAPNAWKPARTPSCPRPAVARAPHSSRSQDTLSLSLLRDPGPCKSINVIFAGHLHARAHAHHH